MASCVRTLLRVGQRSFRRSPATFSTAAATPSAAPTESANLNNLFGMTTDLQRSVRRPDDVVAPYEVYSLLKQDGTARDASAAMPDLSPDEWRKLYTHMVRLKEMDDVLLASQRQGRISFYMTASGEEAIHIGSAAALDPEDEVFAQYREQGVLLWRGASIQYLANQCFGNTADLGKGRQMPVHYGSKAHHFQTISSPLGTQLPQAAGAGYACKLDGQGKVAVVYFGEGAASEGDFHAGMNFASTLEVPMIFFCRNNGYAISTPSKEQFRGDGIASRAYGYDMPCIRVDGNDLAAVYAATSEARRLCLAESRPVLVEAMTYRVGHHSTSDDSTRYRSVEEINDAKTHDPIERAYAFLNGNGWWDKQADDKLRAEERKSVLKALDEAERLGKTESSELFTDVYDKKPKHLLQQEEAFMAHLKKYPDVAAAH